MSHESRVKEWSKRQFKTSNVLTSKWTQSNIGSIGGTSATPIVLRPQVAIGALGRIQTLPRYTGDASLTAHCILSVAQSRGTFSGRNLFIAAWLDLMCCPACLPGYLPACWLHTWTAVRWLMCCPACLVVLYLDDLALPVPVKIMNVSWSADHRIVDGATVARFSNDWKAYVESPTLMLQEMV